MHIANSGAFVMGLLSQANASQAYFIGERATVTVDEGGVAIAGVKALAERSAKQQETIDELKKENAELKSRLDKLEQLVQDLTKPKN